MERKGSITVFLALTLSVLVVLVGAVLESVRVSCGRAHVLNGADVGLYSLFAQYDRELLENYEIFGLHPAVSPEGVPVGQAYKIFEEYMEPVLQVKGISMELGIGGVSGYTLLTDCGGQEFLRQAVEVQKQVSGKEGLKWLEEAIQERAKETQDHENVWEESEGGALTEYDQAIDQALEQEAQEEVQEEAQEEGFQGDSFQEEPVLTEEVENPIQTIRELMDMGILSLVLENPQEVSWTSVDLSQMLSQRELEKGVAMGNSQEKASASERLLFQRYLLDRMGNYLDPGGGVMKNQVEYILYGKESDGENLKSVANRLLLIREGLNLSYLLSSPEKRAQAQSLALAIASAFLFPPAASIIEKALLVCWSFGESVLDLRELFSGGKIGLWKSADTWQLSLENLIHLPELLESGHRGDSEGLSYEDYLQVLLFLESTDTQVMRTLDQVEMERRVQKNNSSFRLDYCMTALEVSVEVMIQDRAFTVTRQYGYGNS